MFRRSADGVLELSVASTLRGLSMTVARLLRLGPILFVVTIRRYMDFDCHQLRAVAASPQ